MSYELAFRDEKGNTTVVDIDSVDIDSVDRFVSQLELGTLPIVDEVEMPSNLSRDQLVLLVHRLTGLVKTYKRYWTESFRPEHQERVDKLRDFKRLVEEQGLFMGKSWETLESRKDEDK